MDRAPDGTPPRRFLWAAGAWALLYALYRGYYALGGTIGMLGEPVSMPTWYAINYIAAALLLVAAVIPIATQELWVRQPWRIGLLGFAWVAAVGCITHALIGIPTRLLSLAGLHEIDYPFWSTIDRRAADLQALFLNEPWFLVQGLLWAAIGALALRSRTDRRRWLATGAIAVAVLLVVGFLSSFGVIGRFVIG